MGEKFDENKPDWSLMPLSALVPVVRVLEFGAGKYARENWQSVPDAERRYFSAAMRHLSDYQRGEIFDKESGLPHIAHAACCLIFMLWFSVKG